MHAALTIREALKDRIGAGVRPERTASDGSLTPLEREVIGIGRRDAHDGAIVSGEGGLLDRLRISAAQLAGRRRTTPLADPRLEALRRFAQRAALGREEITDLGALRHAGFAVSQIVIAARLARQADADGAR